MHTHTHTHSRTHDYSQEECNEAPHIAQVGPCALVVQRVETLEVAEAESCLRFCESGPGSHFVHRRLPTGCCSAQGQAPGRTTNHRPGSLSQRNTTQPLHSAAYNTKEGPSRLAAAYIVCVPPAANSPGKSCQQPTEGRARKTG